MDFDKRKQLLIERVGCAIERQEKMAPLAARITATLILTDKEGISFDQLVHDLNASKSTISTHLEHLQTIGRVTYFTKPGDRKRYFKITSKRFIQIIDDIIDMWDNEKKIHEDIIHFKTDYNKKYSSVDEPAYPMEFHIEYLIFLDEASNSIQKLKQNITNKAIDNND